jgi:hypothetical protein
MIHQGVTHSPHITEQIGPLKDAPVDGVLIPVELGIPANGID